MADNLSIVVSADTSKLTAQLAVAQAELKEFSAQTRTLAESFRTAGDDAKSALLPQLEAAATGLAQSRSHVAALKTELGSVFAGGSGIRAGLESIGLSAREATTGLSRVGAELANGRFEAAAPHLALMAVRMAEANPAALGLAAALGVVGVAAYETISRFSQFEDAIRGVQSRMALVGQTTVNTAGMISGWIERLSGAFDMSTSTAAKLTGAIAQIGGISDSERKKLEDLATAIASLRGGKPDEVGEELAKAWLSGASGLAKLAEGLRLLNSDQQAAMDSAVRYKDTQAAMLVISQALAARFGEQAENLKKFTDQMHTAFSEPLSGQIINPAPDNPTPTGGNPPDRTAYEAGEKLLVQTRETVEKIGAEWGKSGEQRAAAEVAAWQKVIDGAKAGSNAWYEAIREKTRAIVQLHTATAGEISRAYADSQAHINADPGLSQVQKLEATIEVYRQEAADARLSAEQRAEAERELTRTRGELAQEQKNGTLRSLQEEVAAAREGSQARLVAAQNAAEYAINSWGRESAAAKDAVNVMRAAARSYQQQLDEINRSSADTQIRLAKLVLDTKKQGYEADLQSGKVSLEEYHRLMLAEIADELAEDERAITAKHIGDIEGTASAKEAANERVIAEAEADQKIAALSKQVSEAQQRDWQQVTSGVNTAMSQILSGLLQGTQRWQVVVGKAGESMAEKFANDMLSKGLKPIEDRLGELASKMLSVATSAVTGAGGAATQAFGGASATAIEQLTTSTVQQTAETTVSTTSMATLDGSIMSLIVAVNANTTALSTSAGGSGVGGILGAVGQVGGIAEGIPPFAEGTPHVTRGGLARIHAGEAVIPARQASLMRSNIGNGSFGRFAEAAAGGHTFQTGDIHVHPAPGQQLAPDAIAAAISSEFRRFSKHLR